MCFFQNVDQNKVLSTSFLPQNVRVLPRFRQEIEIFRFANPTPPPPFRQDESRISNVEKVGVDGVSECLGWIPRVADETRSLDPG